MERKVCLLGSTGSIGKQTLDAARMTEEIKIVSLAANKNTSLIEKQAREFKVQKVALADENAAKALKISLGDTNIKVLSGPKGIEELSAGEECDTVLSAIVGMTGLFPTLSAIRAKKRLALANKETLVAAGEIVIKEAKKYNVPIIPVDSEHSAIFQCLQACKDQKTLKKILLTASGGPFFGKTKEELKKITKKDALSHPNWEMGKKITIDSATLMNKGLEFIEAMHLFSVSPEQIKILIHRESIVHSMIEFCDNSILAQLSVPDMTLACQYGILYPDRKNAVIEELDLVKVGKLTFYDPDFENFPCLGLAIEGAKKGGNLPAIINAANEQTVELFLKEFISFSQIAGIIEKAIEKCDFIKTPTLEEITFSDGQARKSVLDNISL